MELKTDEIYKQMLSEKKGVVWSLDDIYGLLGKLLRTDINDLRNRHYSEVYRMVNELVTSNYIKGLGKDKTSVRPPLYKKYKVIKEVKNMSEDETLKAISLNKLNLSYYKDKADEFNRDYDILVILNDLMRNKDNYTELSLNELSYELFGYEKSMAKTESEYVSSYGAYDVMNKISLKEDKINCRKKNEPLLNTIYKGFYQNEVRDIIIVENLETYWSLNRFFRESRTKADMLIFGGGYNITKNFAGIVQYGVSVNDNIFYYGDIDLEGIYIFNLFRRNFPEYNISPAVHLYSMLLSSGMQKGVKKSVSPNQKKMEDSELKLFLDFFDKDTARQLYDILSNRMYIPQECLNYVKIKGMERSYLGE